MSMDGRTDGRTDEPITIVSFDLRRGGGQNGHIQGRINRRMPVLSPTVQQVIVHLHTKYLLFFLNSCWEIYYKKLQYSLHGDNIRKNKQDKGGYLSHDTTCRCYSVNQT